VFHRQSAEFVNAEIMDLLLDADEPTRQILVSQLTHQIKHDELERILLQVARLERAAAPQSELTMERAEKARVRQRARTAA